MAGMSTGELLFMIAFGLTIIFLQLVNLYEGEEPK